VRKILNLINIMISRDDIDEWDDVSPAVAIDRPIITGKCYLV